MTALRQSLQALPGQCLHLHRHNLKRSVRDALSGGLDPLHQEITRGRLRHFRQAKKLIGGHSQRLRNPNQRGEVRLPVPTDIMRIAPFAETATPGGLGVGDTKFLRPISQIPTKRIHKNVLFWIYGTRYELIGVIVESILFAWSKI